MNLDRQKVLIEKLIEKTNEGLIEWQPTFKEDMYQLSYIKGSIQISKADGEMGEDFYIYIVNSEGKVIDYFSDIQLDSVIPGENSSWFSKLRDLFDLARRKSLKSDEVIEYLIEEIENEVPF